MRTYSVVLPDEFDELADKIESISLTKNQTISTIIRNMLCEVTGFEPVYARTTRNRRKDKNKPKMG